MTPELAVFLKELVARQCVKTPLNTAKGKASLSGRTRGTPLPDNAALIEKRKKHSKSGETNFYR